MFLFELAKPALLCGQIPRAAVAGTTQRVYHLMKRKKNFSDMHTSRIEDVDCIGCGFSTEGIA